MSDSSMHLKANPVWGSSVYRILLTTDDNRISQDFSGELILFERRHEAERVDFTSLIEFIEKVKELWSRGSTAPVQDTRLARWLVTYLIELGVQTQYTEMLEVVRGDYEEEPPVTMGEAEILVEEDVKHFVSESKDHKIKGTKRTLEISLDSSDEEINNILEHILLDSKPVRNNKADSTISFVNANGQIETLTSEKTIENTPLEEDIHLITGLDNKFSFVIKDVTLSDVIPYDYKISDIKVKGVPATKGAEEQMDDGLKITWNIEELKPGEKTEIEYVLGKNILRTILIRDDQEVTSLQTYEPIRKEDPYYYSESTYIFQSSTPIIENVKILDQIPKDFELVSTQPEANLPFGNINHDTAETEVTWTFTNVKVNSQHKSNYEMKAFRQLIRELIEVIDENEEQLAKIVKIVKPLDHHEGFGVIFSIKTLRPIKEGCTVTDEIPSTFKVIEKHSEGGTAAILESKDITKVVWKLPAMKAGERFEIYFQYMGDATYQSKFVISSEKGQLDFVSEDDVSMKREDIVLPAVYSKLIDPR
jgi:hypothetical protein